MKLKTFKKLLTATELVVGSAAYIGASIIGVNFINHYIPIPKNKFQAILLRLGGGCLGSAIGGVAYKNIKDITDNSKEVIDTIEAAKVYNEIEKLLEEASKYEATDYIKNVTDERNEIFSDDDMTWAKKASKLTKMKDEISVYLSFIAGASEDEDNADEER